MTENTLRDQFAMAALTGLLAGGARVDDSTVWEAYTAADIMLIERQKPKANEGAEK